MRNQPREETLRYTGHLTIRDTENPGNPDVLACEYGLVEYGDGSGRIDTHCLDGSSRQVPCSFEQLGWLLALLGGLTAPAI